MKCWSQTRLLPRSYLNARRSTADTLLPRELTTVSLKSCAIRACRGARQTPQGVLWKHLHSPWNAGDQRKHLQNAQQVRQSVQRHNKGKLAAGTRLMLVACMLRLFFAFVFRVALWLFSASLPALIASAFIKERETRLVRK